MTDTHNSAAVIVKNDSNSNAILQIDSTIADADKAPQSSDPKTLWIAVIQPTDVNDPVIDTVYAAASNQTLSAGPFSPTDTRPELVVDDGDLVKTAKELRDLFVASGRYFDRSGPAQLTGDDPPRVSSLTKAQVVMAAHGFRLPAKATRCHDRGSEGL